MAKKVKKVKELESKVKVVEDVDKEGEENGSSEEGGESEGVVKEETRADFSSFNSGGKFNIVGSGDAKFKILGMNGEELNSENRGVEQRVRDVDVSFSGARARQEEEPRVQRVYAEPRRSSVDRSYRVLGVNDGGGMHVIRRDITQGIEKGVNFGSAFDGGISMTRVADFREQGVGERDTRYYEPGGDGGEMKAKRRRDLM